MIKPNGLKVLGDWVLIPAVIFFAWSWYHGWWMVAGWAVFWVALGVRDGFFDEARHRKLLQD